MTSNKLSDNLTLIPVYRKMKVSLTTRMMMLTNLKKPQKMKESMAKVERGPKKPKAKHPLRLDQRIPKFLLLQKKIHSIKRISK